MSETFAIYHARDPWAMLYPNKERWLAGPGEQYQHVADVNADLARLFALTNHTEGQGWTTRREVVWHTSTPVRSTSIGNVVVCRRNGQAWLVMPAELSEIAYVSNT